jgi:hypothetical protein
VGDGEADLEGPGLPDRRAVLQGLEDRQVTGPFAALAAATARSVCSRPPLATLATSSSVAGLRISNRSSASTQSPPMSIE